MIDAYAAQLAKDTAMFLSARGKEAVSGGIMVLLMPGRADGIAHSCVLSDVVFDLLGLCLMDMAKEVKPGELYVIVSLLLRALYTSAYQHDESAHAMYTL